MNNEKLEVLAEWYTKGQLDFDRVLIRYRCRTIQNFFRGDSCLELGPADGMMTELLKDEFKLLHLVDGSQSLLDKIPLHPSISKYCVLFEEFKPNQKYDTIIMEHILEHIEHPVSILSKVKEWLSPDGVLIVGVPNAKSFHRQIGVKMGKLNSIYDLNERDHQLGHYRVYDKETLRADIVSAGIRNVVHEGGVFFKPVSNQQIQDSWTPEMIEAFYQLGNDFQEYAAEIFIVAEN